MTVQYLKEKYALLKLWTDKHAYKLPFYYATIYCFNYLSVHPSIISDKCHAWFHVYGLRQVASNAGWKWKEKWKYKRQ